MTSPLYPRLLGLFLLSILGLLLTQCTPSKSEDPDPQEPGRANWVELPAMNVPRTGTAVVTLADGSVLACGGLALADKKAAPTEIYNPTTNAWQQLSGAGLGVTAPNLLRLRNGDVVAFGGYGTNGSTSFVWRYSAATRTWTVVGQLGFMSGPQFVETLDAATELRDGTVVLATSNRAFLLKGTTLQKFSVTNWGDAYYHGTALVGLPNGNFLALWNTRATGDALFVAREYNPAGTDDAWVRQIPNWLPTATSLATALVNDSTLLILSGYGQGKVTLAGYTPTLVNLRTGATRLVASDVTHNFMPTTLLKLSDGRWVAVSLGTAHKGMSIFDPATQQWKAAYNSAVAQAWWPADDQLANAAYGSFHSFATVLPGDDLFVAGWGLNWRLKKP